MVNRFQRLLLFAAAGALFILHQNLCDASVMMEYIGASGNPISFDQVPIQDDIDFYFILGFAVDAQQGTFLPKWEETLTPEAVSSIKSAHPDVKVLVSLSGWSNGGEIVKWYKPTDSNTWISNAFSSLQTLIAEYNLDGIDIDYETFEDQESFPSCIGELITQLKSEGVISVATIAPFANTVTAYAELFKNCGDQIDYVNYQFYADESTKTPDDYLKAFQDQAQQFDRTKLLPSYEVKGRGLQGDSFFDALRLLRENGFDVSGVMVFSADDSVENGFDFETKSQAFLLNTSTAPPC